MRRGRTLAHQDVPDLRGCSVTGADRYRHVRTIRAGCRICEPGSTMAKRKGRPNCGRLSWGGRLWDPSGVLYERVVES